MQREAVTFAAVYVSAVAIGASLGAPLGWLSLALLPVFAGAWLALRRFGGAHVPSSEPQRSWQSRREAVTDRIAELSDVGVIQMTRDGTLEFASRRARELLGIGGPPEPGDAWPPIADTIRRKSDPNATSAGSYEIETRTGTVALNFKIHPVFDEDWAGYLVQVRDRRMLDALRDDLRSAARQRALNQIHVGVAHDVRGSLNAAILNLESLSAFAADEGLESGFTDRIALLRDELDRLHRTLEMLLDQAAPERNERRPFDLEELAQSIAGLLETRARQQGVTIELIKREPAPVVANPDRLRAALLAIAINSLESMPDGGVLRLTTGQRDAWAALDISDSGGGIPDDVAPRIFDLHFTTKTSGTGVGLWAARSIVDAEQGMLSVVATSPSGTTFRLSLPRALEA